jgi:hypothetical protein
VDGGAADGGAADGGAADGGAADGGGADGGGLVILPKLGTITPRIPVMPATTEPREASSGPELGLTDC